jgi:hypothetical protein
MRSTAPDAPDARASAGVARAAPPLLCVCSLLVPPRVMSLLAHSLVLSARLPIIGVGARARTPDHRVAGQAAGDLPTS